MTILSVIILSYNTKELTLNCLKSIVSNYKKKLEDREFEIILVDNGSKDGTVTSMNNLQLTVNNLRIIENKENFGFSKGNNIGAKKAAGKYLLFLNSDAEVVDDGLYEMIDFLEKHQEAALVGGALKNYDGTFQGSTGPFYNLFFFFLMLFGFERIGMVRKSFTKTTSVDWVSGAFMMARRDIFEKLGGFDEHFFMYLEDMELCFRVKQLGYNVYFYPQVAVLHKEHGSSDRSFAIIQIYKGFGYLFKKHKPFWQQALVKFSLKMKAYSLIYFAKIIKDVNLKETYTKALKSL